MRSLLGCLIFMLVCVVGISAQAQDSWILYDDFNSEFIDVGKWTTSQRIDGGVTILEYVRELHGGRLHMVDRAFGYTPSTGPYSGTRRGDINAIFGMGRVYNGVKVSVKPKEVEVTGCPLSNTTYPSSAGARLVVFFFNNTYPNPNPTNRIGDVLAQILIHRTSDSTDKPQLLEVRAEVWRCINSDCTTGIGIEFSPSNSISLGKIMLGQWANIEVEWDKESKRFIFMLNGMPAIIKYPSDWVEYPVSSPSNFIGLRNAIANCPADQRGMAYIYAEFDNLYVKELPNP